MLNVILKAIVFGLFSAMFVYQSAILLGLGNDVSIILATVACALGAAMSQPAGTK